MTAGRDMEQQVGAGGSSADICIRVLTHHEEGTRSYAPRTWRTLSNYALEVRVHLALTNEG